MTEYMGLLNLAEKPDQPMAHLRGLIQVLKTTEQYMTPEDHLRFQLLEDSMRKRLMPYAESARIIS